MGEMRGPGEKECSKDCGKVVGISRSLSPNCRAGQIALIYFHWKVGRGKKEEKEGVEREREREWKRGLIP